MLRNMEKSRNNSKITGYLEKKGRNVICSYKKYWFVLEGGLLLYYRSKDDYDTISPFKGSINLGPPCKIKPLLSTAGAFQIQTRTATITLRAYNQEEQNRWMQAIMSEINPNKSPQKLSHFRYSLDELPHSKERTDSERKFERSEEEPSPSYDFDDPIIQRLQKIGGQSYGNPLLSTISRAATHRIEKKYLPREFTTKSSEDLKNIDGNSEMVGKTSSEHRRDSKSFENVYEQIPSEVSVSDHCDVPVLVNIEKSMSLPRKIQSTIRVETDKNRPITFILENDTYECIIRKGSINKSTPKKSLKKNTSFLFSKNKYRQENDSSHLMQDELYAFTPNTAEKPTESDETIKNHNPFSGRTDVSGKSNKNQSYTNKNNKHSSNSSEKQQTTEYSKENETLASSPKINESILLENDLYGCTIRDKEIHQLQTTPENNSHKNNNKSFSSNKTNKHLCDIDEQEEGLISLSNRGDKNERSTFLQENEIYATVEEVNEKGQTDEVEVESRENAVYARPIKEKKLSITENTVGPIANDQYLDTMYSEVDIVRDHNENNVISQIHSEENLYSIPDVYGVNYDKVETTNEARYVEYAEPDFSKENKVFAKGKKSKQDSATVCDKGNSRLKKTSSFIRRVWKKKVKHKEKTENEHLEENLYETVLEPVVENIAIADGKTLQMLSELQNILERKKPILIQKLATDVVSSKNSRDLETISEKNDDRSPEHNSSAQRKEQQAPAHPDLPVKTQNMENPSPFHDIPKNNKPVRLPPKKISQVESINEILDQLENQNDSTNKVRNLIKRFSETDVFNSDVVLRTNRKTRESIDSDELSKLLEELAAVTNAPILTPGVTSSLNGSNIGNGEFYELLPERKRRHSEPDYDIPRPHKSLTILPKRDDTSENVIGSTRFFGPILKPSDMAVPFNNRDSSETLCRLSSITPDSLEGNVPQRTPTPLRSSIEDECEPHHYYKFMDRRAFLSSSTSSPPNTQKNWSMSSVGSVLIENDIYVDPKSIRFNLRKDDIEDHHCKPDVVGAEEDEVFIDSLENDNSGTTEEYTAL